MERNLTVWRIVKNKVIQKLIYYAGKSTLKRFGFSKPSSGLKDGETSIDRTMMDVLIKFYLCVFYFQASIVVLSIHVSPS